MNKKFIKKLHRLTSCLLATAMLAGWFPALANEFPDMLENYASNAMRNAIANGLLTGSDEGMVMPLDNLTRAQLATIMGRAFGAVAKADISQYTDVSADKWYYDAMSQAVAMGVISGDGESLLMPDNPVTREQTFAIISRALKLEPAESSSIAFEDAGSISAWAQPEVNAMVNAGYISGDGVNIRPQENISRQDFAIVFDNIIKQYVKTEGEITSVVETGNVMVSAPNVVFKDVTINGDLLIGDGVGEGDIKLDGVTVMGQLLVRGGGVNSIEVTGNSNLPNVTIFRPVGDVRFKVSGAAKVDSVRIANNSGDVSLIGIIGTLNIGGKTRVHAIGSTLSSVTLNGAETDFTLSEGSAVNQLSISQDSSDSHVTLNAGTSIANLLASVATNISNQGTIARLELGVTGSTITGKTAILTTGAAILSTTSTSSGKGSSGSGGGGSSTSTTKSSDARISALSIGGVYAILGTPQASYSHANLVAGSVVLTPAQASAGTVTYTKSNANSTISITKVPAASSGDAPDFPTWVASALSSGDIIYVRGVAQNGDTLFYKIVITVEGDLLSNALTVTGAEKTLVITLVGGKFKTPIAKTDFEFIGTNKDAILAGTFTRVSDTVVTISGVDLVAATDDVVKVPLAAQSEPALSVTFETRPTTAISSAPMTATAENNAVKITLSEGTFKEGAITAADFEFSGTNKTALEGGTFKRVNATTVAISDLTLAASTNDVVVVKVETQNIPAVTVTMEAFTTATIAKNLTISDNDHILTFTITSGVFKETLNISDLFIGSATAPAPAPASADLFETQDVTESGESGTPTSGSGGGGGGGSSSVTSLASIDVDGITIYNGTGTNSTALKSGTLTRLGDTSFEIATDPLQAATDDIIVFPADLFVLPPTALNSSSGGAVVLAPGSLGTVGNNKITGLTAGLFYKVEVGATTPVTKFVGANRTLNNDPTNMRPLVSTEITGLLSGETYKVITATPLATGIKTLYHEDSTGTAILIDPTVAPTANTVSLTLTEGDLGVVAFTFSTDVSGVTTPGNTAQVEASAFTSYIWDGSTAAALPVFELVAQTDGEAETNEWQQYGSTNTYNNTTKALFHIPASDTSIPYMSDTFALYEGTAAGSREKTLIFVGNDGSFHYIKLDIDVIPAPEEEDPDDTD